MPIISAFRGLRYDLGHVGALQDVIAPSPAAINLALQDDLYKRHPANIVRLIRNRGEPGDLANATEERVGRFFRNWQREGVLQREPDPALYLYHHEFEVDGAKCIRRGFMGLMRIQPDPSDTQFVAADPAPPDIDDRFQLIHACHGNLIPVLGLYADPDAVVQQTLEDHVVGKTPVEASEVHAASEGTETHRIWPITDIRIINDVTTQIASQPFLIVGEPEQYVAARQYQQEVQAREIQSADSVNHVMVVCVGQHDDGMSDELIPFFYEEGVSANPSQHSSAMRSASKPWCGLVLQSHAS